MANDIATKKPRASRKKKQEEIKPLMTSQCEFALLLSTPENVTYQVDITSAELRQFVVQRGSVKIIDIPLDTIQLQRK